ncbi:MAG: hypothetical protein U5L11_06140 [Arhodomonas sp.]|nr:hypothetical protein [Arhodomonas sp.]
MAAGLTLPRTHFGRFEALLREVAGQWIDEQDLTATLYTDGPLAPAELSLETAMALRSGGPWGQGFPEPVFEGRFRVLHRRVVGGDHLKLSVTPADADTAVDAIAFGAVEAGWHGARRAGRHGLPPGGERLPGRGASAAGRQAHGRRALQLDLGLSHPRSGCQSAPLAAVR